MALANSTVVRVTELQMKDGRVWRILSTKRLFRSLIPTRNFANGYSSPDIVPLAERISTHIRCTHGRSILSADTSIVILSYHDGTCSRCF
ncbi:uncharacterized protein ARMOST_18993 [Armillaria ostoyae]|uniref:Uncharacterized protein n=1 Tax=Armillaria ostoyae TaxID=47428 RepID=A0A284S3B6_ARMOS|nr:uncharacterized protein ARMOST_18993 [Armillaria ostoyae]